MHQEGTKGALEAEYMISGKKKAQQRSFLDNKLLMTVYY